MWQIRHSLNRFTTYGTSRRPKRCSCFFFAINVYGNTRYSKNGIPDQTVGIYTLFQTKMAKSIPYFRLEMLENGTLWGGTYLYGLYMGVPPPPPPPGRCPAVLGSWLMRGHCTSHENYMHVWLVIGSVNDQQIKGTVSTQLGVEGRGRAKDLALQTFLAIPINLPWSPIWKSSCWGGEKGPLISESRLRDCEFSVRNAYDCDLGGLIVVCVWTSITLHSRGHDRLRESTT